MNEAVRITFSGNTDLGMVRKNNEDAFVVMNVWDDMHVLAVAIDGVGGYEGGEVAAAIARDSIVQYLNENKEGEKAELLKRALVFANNNIYAERHRDAERSHMSCVLTAVLVDVAEQYINMAHVGDTRLYQYCDGEFVKLSHDHSVVGYREEIGDLTEEEAMHHPQRNVISRDVGSRYLSEEDDEYVEVNSFPLLPNSTLLLCSDGLCDMVTSAEMTAVISCDTSLEHKVSALISAANAAGGRDNVTVVLVEYCADDDGLLGVPDSSELVSVGEGNEASASSVSVEEHETGTDKKTFFRRIRFPLLAAVIVAVAGAAFYFGTKYNDVTEGDNASVEIKGQSPCAVEPLPADTMEVDTLGTEEPQPIITEEV